MKSVKYFLKEILEEKQLIKDSFIVSVTAGVSSIVLFIAYLKLSNFFGPELFGVFKKIIYSSSFIAGLIDFGMTLTLTKFVAEFRAKNKKKISYLIWSFFKIRIAIYAIVLVGIFLFKSQIATHFLHDPSLSYLVIPLIFLIGIGFLSVLPAIVTGYENFKVLSIYNIVNNLLFLVIGLPLGYYFGIYYAILAFGLSTVISILICIKYLINENAFQKNYEKFDMKRIFMNYSIPLYILSFPSYLINAVIPALGLFFSNKIIGYYSFGLMFYFIPSIVSNSLSRVLFPKISKLNGSKNTTQTRSVLKRVFMIYSVFVVLGIFATLAFSKLFISLFASEYLPGLMLFKSLLILGLFSGYGTILNFYFNAKEKLKEGALVLLLTTILLFIFSFILLKMMG